MVGRLKMLGFVIVLGASASVFGATVSENFNNNTDGYWDHSNNQPPAVTPQNYGWRAADGTVNQSGSNALGGSFVRSAAPANFYGFNIGSHDPAAEGFTASGKVFIQQRDGGAGWNFGFFSGASSYGSGGDARNAMVFGLSDGNNSQLFSYSNTGGRDRSGIETNLPAGGQYTFDMTWQPPPAGSSEKGLLTAHVNGVTHSLQPGDISWDPITHFGVFSTSAAGGTAVGYLDDLTFTSKNPIPEPASLSLLAMGVLGTLRRRRRRE